MYFSMVLCAGLGAYQRPQELPIDLNMKMNTFIKKDDSEATPVECILDAVIQGDGEQGLSLNSAHICTFRNNLNKIFLTPFAPDKAWVLDACLMNASGSQLLCLDIVKLDEKWVRMHACISVDVAYVAGMQAMCKGVHAMQMIHGAFLAAVHWDKGLYVQISQQALARALGDAAAMHRMQAGPVLACLHVWPASIPVIHKRGSCSVA